MNRRLSLSLFRDDMLYQKISDYVKTFINKRSIRQDWWDDFTSCRECETWDSDPKYACTAHRLQCWIYLFEGTLNPSPSPNATYGDFNELVYNFERWYNNVDKQQLELF